MDFDKLRTKKEGKMMGNFRRIFPSEDRDLEKFEEFMRVAKVVWEEFTGSSKC